MASAAADLFTFINHPAHTGDEDGPPHLFDKYTDLTSAKLPNPIIQLLDELRNDFPEYVVTWTLTGNINLLAFAAAGYASATLDTDTESVLRLRYWVQPLQRGGVGQLGEETAFAKYRYRWGNEDFILYTVVSGSSSVQFVLKERAPDEGQLSHSAATDALLSDAGKWQHKEREGIWVFDRRWYLDQKLYDSVQKSLWENVILDPGMKKELTRISGRFFDSKDVYDDLGVPWKRGLIFYGPAGNGKTISIKALMHTLADRKQPVPTLYVKAAPATYDIRAVFSKARQMSPCLLVLEDIDTIVAPSTRSYFFNEVDGLESNDGVLMVASTNHIDRLDPGLSKRPSRFDRKYLFPEPSQSERVEYVRFWKRKLHSNKEVEFPEKLVLPIARITHGFSFAYMQEAFVATLLEMAHRRDEDEDEDDGDDEDGVHNNDIATATSKGPQAGGGDDLDDYELWRVMQQQVKTLREEMGSDSQQAASADSVYMTTN